MIGTMSKLIARSIYAIDYKSKYDTVLAIQIPQKEICDRDPSRMTNFETRREKSLSARAVNEVLDAILTIPTKHAAVCTSVLIPRASKHTMHW